MYQFHELRMTASEWHNGPTSAMYKFWMQKPFLSSKLLSEVRRCVKENVMDEQRKCLDELLQYAERRVRRQKALKALDAAITECRAVGFAVPNDWKVNSLNLSNGHWDSPSLPETTLRLAKDT